jgi:hypothetical protein
MTATPTLYSIAPAQTAEQLNVTQSWAQDGGTPLAAGYAHLVPVTAGGALNLLAIGSDGTVSAFAVSAGTIPLTPGRTDETLGGAFDIVEPFILGEAQYLLGYAATPGEMSFFPIGPDLSIAKPYTFSRIRSPGITKGFTVTKPIVVGGLLYILCYAAGTGAVSAYSLAVTSAAQPGSPPGTPPLLATPVWDHGWARNWTNFAFFELGSENFFFKINTGKLNVNIDHVLDTPSLGTVEVGTYLQLDDALKINLARSFTINGDPYFITYISDGTTVVRRFRGDCQGWVQQAALTTVAGATQIVPLALGDDVSVLFY